MAAALRSCTRHVSQQQILRSLINSIGSRAVPYTPSLLASPRAFATTSRCSENTRGAQDVERSSPGTLQEPAEKEVDREQDPRSGHEGLQEKLYRYSPYPGGIREIREHASEPPQTQPEAASRDDSSFQELSQATSSAAPWYLQVQQEQPFQNPSSPMSARQQLPPLPLNPPDLLEPLLKHVSVELGMDDLTLLDLRTLDPPPALGANLVMIIGTARSEKHLHVSADRLCRWLRSQYKLRPYADGLLGRNELKLKVRRLAKRTRMMSAVGAKATADAEVEDGIRTGWVCVNVGRVEGGELGQSSEGKLLEDEEDVVGFGTRTSGSSIVVQMLTEEKRGVVDLEKLWTGILNRSKREAEAASIGEQGQIVDSLLGLEGEHVDSSSRDVRAA